MEGKKGLQQQAFLLYCTTILYTVLAEKLSHKPDGSFNRSLTFIH